MLAPMATDVSYSSDFAFVDQCEQFFYVFDVDDLNFGSWLVVSGANAPLDMSQRSSATLT